MYLTVAEEQMYQVMKAIYDSRIPIDFKGSMVLKACLVEAGYSEETRHTVDIDGNWRSDAPPTADQMTESMQKALTQSGIDLEVKLYRMYGEGRSAGFELKDRQSGEVLFTMDMDVNRPAQNTKIYEIVGFQFCGATPTQMLADKLSAISSDKVFRRVKDVVDLYYLSKVFPFDKAAVLQTLKSSGRELEKFNGFLGKTDELKHAYDKFRLSGIVNKPPFEEVYGAVKAYIKPVLPQERRRDEAR